MTDILQFEEEIGRLEARISHLENENEALKKLLDDRDSFSAAVAVKIHKMDCLLDKRMSIITDLMSKLEKGRRGHRKGSPWSKFTWNYPIDPGQSGQDSTELVDFSMDLGPVNDVKVEAITGKFEEKVYMEHLDGKPEGMGT